MLLYGFQIILIYLILQAMAIAIKPFFLDTVKPTKKNQDTDFNLQGSLLSLNQASVKTTASLDPFGCRKCTIPLISGDIKSLTITFKYDCLPNLVVIIKFINNVFIQFYSISQFV